MKYRPSTAKSPQKFYPILLHGTNRWNIALYPRILISTNDYTGAISPDKKIDLVWWSIFKNPDVAVIILKTVEEKVPLFKGQIKSSLMTMSDSDPGALADYMLALLRHEKQRDELKAFCINQLGDFLHERKSYVVQVMLCISLGTEWFVESILRRLEGNEADQLEVGEAKEEINCDDTHNHNNKIDDRRQFEEREPDRRFRREREREREREGRDYGRSRGRNFTSRRSRSPGSYRRDNRMYDPNNHRYYPRQPSLLPHHQNQYQHRAEERFGRRESRRLVIDKIPPEYCSISKVNEYFARFGSIVNITVHPEISRARIEYATEAEAQAAHSCPDVIFENRFVKVFWDHDALPTPIQTSRTTAPSFRSSETLPQSPYQGLSPPSQTSMASMPAPLLSDSAVQKKREALKGMLELQKQKQELLLRYIDQQKVILARLESKSLPDGERDELMKTLKSVDELIKSLKLTHATSEVTATNFPETQPHVPILRGGPVSRGRGGFRGDYQPPAASLSGSRRLDLRPTAFSLHPIPPRIGRDINSFQQIFGSYGIIKNITIDSDKDMAIISFAKRTDAEKAFAYISKADMGDPFEVSWITSQNASSLAKPTTSSNANDQINHSNENNPASPGEQMDQMEAMEFELGQDQIMFDTEEQPAVESEDSHWRR